MPEQQIQILPEHYALDQIVETIQQAERGEAPFALVLGSGFSHGLVPTTKELVSESLPLWIKSLKEGKPMETQLELSGEERLAIARANGRSFSGIIERLAWPQTEIELRLRKSLRALHIHDLSLEGKFIETIPHQRIYLRQHVALPP